MATTSLIERAQREYREIAAQLPEHVAAPRQREAALAALAQSGLPANRDENWRYANLRALDRAAFKPLAAATLPPGVALPTALTGHERFVFVDGRLDSTRSASLETTAARRTIRSLTRSVHATPLRASDARFSLLSDAFAVDGLTIEVPAAAQTALEIVFVASGAASAGSSYPRLSLHARRGSKVALVERHLSFGEAASMVNCTIDLHLDEDAEVEHTRWQDLGGRTQVIDTLQANAAARSHYRLRQIATGAAAGRSTLHIHLAGREARCEFDAVSVADGAQALDAFAEIQHGAPGTATRQVFRGIASGRSKVAFNGKMIVAAEALGAHSDQSLKTLLAGAEAEIAARPQLEIYTDDVRASHGATAGKLDETMLFYLLSRGLERETAQALLQWAFVEDCVARVRPEGLRREIEARLARQIADVSALDGLLEKHQ